MDFDIPQRAPWRLPLLFSVIILNICLPSLVFSYGVLLVHLVNLEVPIWLGFSAPTFYILTYGLSQCWCREAADSWGGSVGYRVMGASGLLILVASVFICAFVPYNVLPYVFGILGGFGTSLISAQVEAVVFETYDSRLGLIRGLCFAGQAVGQATFSHIITFLVDIYEYSHSYIVLSAIMLQTMPAILFLKVAETTRRPVSFSRYSDVAKTYSVFSNDGLEENFFSNDLPLQDLNKKYWKSPSDDGLHIQTSDFENFENEQGFDDLTMISPPSSPDGKPRNIFGVEILPEIPEESEEESDDDEESINKGRSNKKKLSIAIKRLSILGDNFDDCIAKQFRRDSQFSDNSTREGSEGKEFVEVEVTYDNVSPVTEVQREKVFNSFSFQCQSAYASMRRKIWIPSYRLYRIRRRLLYVTYILNDTFIKPLTRSLSTWKFYPSLLLAFSKLSLTAVLVTLLPLIGSKMELGSSTTGTNFLLSLYGFTWLCFLLSTPWLVQTPKRNYKYITVIGLMVSTAACFVLSIAENNDLFSIGCIVAGFGYGAISSSWETTAQDFLGARKWPKIHSTLETLSALALTGFVVGLAFVVDSETGLQLTMFILCVTLAAISVVWIIISLVSIYLTKVRFLRLNRK